MIRRHRYRLISSFEIFYVVNNVRINLLFKYTHSVRVQWSVSAYVCRIHGSPFPLNPKRSNGTDGEEEQKKTRSLIPVHFPHRTEREHVPSELTYRERPSVVHVYQNSGVADYKRFPTIFRRRLNSASEFINNSVHCHRKSMNARGLMIDKKRLPADVPAGREQSVTRGLCAVQGTRLARAPDTSQEYCCWNPRRMEKTESRLLSR